jgi:hypothetical protein
VSTLECHEFGQITFVGTDGACRYYYRAQFPLDDHALQQLRSMAECAEGVDSAEPSDSPDSTFVIILKPEVLGIEGAATAASEGLVTRLIKWSQRGQQQKLMGWRPDLFDGMAVHSDLPIESMRRGS